MTGDRWPAPGADPREIDAFLDRFTRADSDVAALLRTAGSAPNGSTSVEDTAIRAFREASPVPLARTGGPRLLVAKVATIKAVLVLAGTGGSIALAARLDVLSPSPAPAPVVTTPGPTAGPTVTPSHHPGSREPSTSDPTAGPVEPAAHCAAYLAHPAKDRAKLLDTPAYADLVAAAGGPAAVDGYCGVTPSPTPAPDTTASIEAQSTSTQQQQHHPHSGPTQHPTGPPTPHPHH